MVYESPDHEPGFTITQVFPEKKPTGALRVEWERLLSGSDNYDLLYQSFEWFDHLQSAGKEDSDLFLWTIRNRAEELVGILPVRVYGYQLKFDVRSRSFATVPVQVASILGNCPAVPSDKKYYDAIIDTVSAALPNCEALYFDSVRSDTYLWKYLHGVDIRKLGFVPHFIDGIRRYHLMVLPATVEDFWARFNRKKRYKLQRQLKRLQEAGGDAFSLERVTSEEEVPKFLERAAEVSSRSWQHARIGVRVLSDGSSIEKYADLARRGILRCYLLRCGAPCAFILGYQYQGVYHYVEIGYDRSFNRFSPGTMLFYFLVKDLIENSELQSINFGVGHADYKQSFGTHHLEDASVILFRKTFRNYFIQKSHSLFRAAVRMFRSFSKKT